MGLGQSCRDQSPASKAKSQTTWRFVSHMWVLALLLSRELLLGCVEEVDPY